MKKINNRRKSLDYWLHFFGFAKRERSIKEKMCDTTVDLLKTYKEEAREATRELRRKIEGDKQVA